MQVYIIFKWLFSSFYISRMDFDQKAHVLIREVMGIFDPDYYNIESEQLLLDLFFFIYRNCHRITRPIKQLDCASIPTSPHRHDHYHTLIFLQLISSLTMPSRNMTLKKNTTLWSTYSSNN